MKLTTTKLVGLLALLVAIYFGIEFLGGKGKSKSLRSEWVQIDTATVTRLQITAPQNSASVSKNEGSWEVTLENGNVVPADKNTIIQALNALNGIKPSRMATRKKEKWAEYQVDSTGISVSVFANSKKVSEIILGKLGVSGQRSYHTYVRMAEDDEVYVADNFMSMSIPSEPAGFRLNALATIDMDSLSSVQFTYPSDSSFRLEKSGDKWQANGLPVDSAKLETYLRGLNFVTSRKFMNQESELNQIIYKAEFSLNSGEQITIDAYLHESGLVFNSSENTTSYFADSAVYKKAFVGFSTLQ